MATSQIQIYNLALGHLGISTFVASLTERSKEATVCNQFFDGARDSLLELFDWNFARKRVRLALSPTVVTNWGYTYLHPTDAVKARRIAYPELRSLSADQRIPFEIATDGSARLILTDQVDAELIYTVRVTDPNLFAATFADALAAQLATRIAMPLSVSTTVKDAAEKKYVAVLNTAIAVDLREGQDDVPPEADLIAARY